MLTMIPLFAIVLTTLVTGGAYVRIRVGQG